MRWTCTRCGRDMEVLEAAVDDTPLCHDGPGPTCYELWMRGPVMTRQDLADELRSQREAWLRAADDLAGEA